MTVLVQRVDEIVLGTVKDEAISSGLVRRRVKTRKRETDLMQRGGGVEGRLCLLAQRVAFHASVIASGVLRVEPGRLCRSDFAILQTHLDT